MAAEQRYMRTMHSEASKAKPGSQSSTDAQTDIQLCSVVFDIEQQQRMHVLPRPVYAVSPDGQKATSFAFDRLDAVEAGEHHESPVLVLSARCACCIQYMIISLSLSIQHCNYGTAPYVYGYIMLLDCVLMGRQATLH